MNMRNAFILIFFVLMVLLYFQSEKQKSIVQSDEWVQQKSFERLPVSHYDIEEYNYTINEPFVVLRIDDIQAYAWNKVGIAIIETILNKDMAVTVAVIPNAALENDTLLVDYLRRKVSDPKLEIAMHGFNHSDKEFEGLNESETYEQAVFGINNIEQVLRIKPITVTPPLNSYDNNTTRALSKVGLKVMSTGGNELYSDDYMKIIGSNVEMKYFSQKDLTPNEVIINTCKDSFARRNSCVILLHPQDFTQADNINMDEEKYTKFIELLDEIKQMNAKSVTFKDIAGYQIKKVDPSLDIPCDLRNFIFNINDPCILS